MIKKNLGLLAGSILLASGVNAATVNPAVLGAADEPSSTTGSDMLLLLVDSTTSNTLVYNAGITADTLAAGGNVAFSVDLTSNANYAGFNADGYALFGITSGSTAYSTIFETYADTGIGLVYATSAATSIPAGSDTLRPSLNEVNAYIDLANGNDILSAVDSFNNKIISTQFGGMIQSIGSVNNIFSTTTNDGIVSTTKVYVAGNLSGGNILIHPETINTAFVLGNNFYVEGNLSYEPEPEFEPEENIVPVPASFWFMGSALAGIAVYRSKRK